MPEAYVSRRAGAVRGAVALVAAAAALMLPAPALAADPPTIVSAGIDASDQLYVTWTLGAGTTYQHAEFATVPTPDPDLPGFFADGNFADFDCLECGAPPTSTSYTGTYPVPRDRRYFVVVTAKAGGQTLVSAVWVIDETKPVIPGDALSGPGPATSTPAAGKPFDGASLLPAGVTSTGSLTVRNPPKTVRGLLAAGVRIRVACSFACSFDGSLKLGERNIGRVLTGYGSAGARTVVIKPNSSWRARLRRQPRTRLRVVGVVVPLEGARRRVSRLFAVTR